MRSTTLAAAAAAALTLALTATLTGCTPGNSTDPSPAPSAAPASTAGLPAGVAQAGTVPTNVPNDPAARTNVHITGCAAADGGWKATGTATNPGKTAASYTITVFFTTDQATVLATADTKITVDPGKNADWTITKKFTPAPKTLCALRGVG